MANVIDTEQPGRCTDVDCRAPIYWRQEKSGKRNPYNPPETCPKCGGGGGVTDVDTDVWTQCARCEGKGRVQVSHFATCPGSAKFRKPKA